MNIRKKSIQYIFLLMMITILVGCNTESSVTVEEDTVPVFPVEISEVYKGSISSDVTVSGNIMADKIMPILPMVTGEVKAVHVKNGDTVKRGDILLEVDAADLELNISQARASLEAAEANLNGTKAMREQSIKQAELQLKQARDVNKMLAEADSSVDLDLGEIPEEFHGVFESLLESNMPTEHDRKQAETAVKQAEMALNQARGTEQIEAAEASVKQAKIAVEMAENQKTHAVVRAPMDGQVSHLNLSVGEMVSPQAPLLQLVNMDKPVVQVNINESLLPSVEVGQTVDVHIRSFNKTLEGHISYIGLMPTEQSLAYPVEIVISEPDDYLRVGMMAEVAFTPLNKTEDLLIPVNAVNNDNGEMYVFVTSDGESVERRVITIEQETSELFSIASGLDEGEYIVIRGAHQLFDGALINIRNDIGQRFRVDNEVSEDVDEEEPTDEEVITVEEEATDEENDGTKQE